MLFTIGYGRRLNVFCDEKKMIKEVIVVEGKSDIAAVNRAVVADCIATGGVKIAKEIMREIKTAYKKRGIIILTDPDAAGEHIRRLLTTRFPKAKHAFVSQTDATKDTDVGVENANVAAITAALAKVRGEQFSPTVRFTEADMRKFALVGAENAAANRAKIGATLGIGFANAKIFLKRLNRYGITHEEFAAAVAQNADLQEKGNNDENGCGNCPSGGNGTY